MAVIKQTIKNEYFLHIVEVILNETKKLHK